MANCLYEVLVRVLNREGSGLPDEFVGAVCACYVAAPDPLTSVKRAKQAVEMLGYVFDDLMSDQVRELDISSWDAYLQLTWPEATNEMPAQSELPGLLQRGIVFLGPLVGFVSR